jgi:osmoprotectant transport system substrate-binding protein
MKKQQRTQALGVLLALSLVSLALAQKGTVTVGSKLDSEGRLLGQMILLTLEQAGFKVVDKTGTGTTPVVRKALVEGQIDVYPEYTGSAINNFFAGQKIAEGTSKNASKSYATVKTLDSRLNNIVWLERAPANNTFAVAITKAVAQKEKLVSMTDFARFVNAGGAVKVAGSQEFFERDDGLPSFEKAYAFKLKAEQKVVLAGATTAQTEQAAANGTNGVNAAMAYGTDGAIDALGLVVMSDPKGAQAVYQPAPTVRGEVYKKYPEMATLLNPIFKGLTLTVLQGLNRQIDLDGKAPVEVAKVYLKAKGFLK